MHTLIDPLREPEFVRALLDVIIVAIVAGAVGTFIVLRGTGFLGDAMAHAIFPGVVIAFLAGFNLLVGALISGLGMAALMGVLATNSRVRTETAIGVIFTAAFAVGVIILTGNTIGGEELEDILFGDPLGAAWGDVVLTTAIAAGVLVTVIALRRLFVMASFDPIGARAMGLHVPALDILLLVLTALTVVIAFKAVGNILVIALLITPAATARVLTDRLAPMAVIAAAVGSISSVIGAYVAYHSGASSGGTIVLVATVAFLLTWLFAPRHGVVPAAILRRSRTLLDEGPEAEAEIILASQSIRAPHEA